MEIEEKTLETTQEKEPTLYEFVASLFEGQGKTLSKGRFSIEMDDLDVPKLVLTLYDNKDCKTVDIYWNNKKLGEFKKYEGQGLKYEFNQTYRTGIREGRTLPEQFMEDTCIFHKDKIRLNKAYH